MQKKNLRVIINAPATIGFCLLCLIAMVLNIITGGKTNQLLFSVYHSSLADPLTYLRFFTHALGHSSWSHFFGNILTFMILGPMMEEKYGAPSMVVVYAVTALVTGLLSYIFFPHTAMLGASGVVFALIMLSSFVKTEKNTIPLTLILVACLYAGQQLYEAFSSAGNVAYIGHFGGAVVGIVFGFLMNVDTKTHG